MKRSGEPLEKKEKKKYVRKLPYLDLDQGLLEEVIANGAKILPSGINKYTGSVWYHKNHDKWKSLFQNSFKHIRNGTHATKEEAIARVKEVNIAQNLPIKNVVYIYKNEYYCVLTKGKIMKFSKENLQLVEQYAWCAAISRGVPYAVTSERLTTTTKIHLYYHRMVFPFGIQGNTMR